MEYFSLLVDYKRREHQFVILTYLVGITPLLIQLKLLNFLLGMVYRGLLYYLKGFFERLNIVIGFYWYGFQVQGLGFKYLVFYIKYFKCFIMLILLHYFEGFYWVFTLKYVSCFAYLRETSGSSCITCIMFHVLHVGH